MFEQGNGKMTIGLALGSGAAKGWAHLGVLRGLSKLGIQANVVSGTSIGAVVGAAYANDLHQDLEDWVLGFSSWDVLGLMDLSWRKGGLIGGEKVFDVLQKRIGDMQIESLPLPFAAVATDLYSGQEIWFRKGDLRRSVRASCSMPGILPPVKQSGRWLVDGAVVNPVPVSACRALGADFVIAVDLNGHRNNATPAIPVDLDCHQLSEEEQASEQAEQQLGFMDLLARGKEYIGNLSDKFSLGKQSEPGMLAVMSQSMDILEQRHKRARLMGDPPDICIVPDVADIGIMEFHRAEEAILAGEQAVEQVKHLILAALK